MTDTATKCNATLDAAMCYPGGWDRRVHVCASEPGHVLGHTSAPHASHGLVWSDEAVGAKAHQVQHRLDARDPDYLLQLLDQAWGVIANAGGWPGTSEPSPGWLPAAERWREEWHAVLDDSRSVAT